ncbi:GspH/FimT family pseudopilin [Shewanella sediminis]|uniref:GspH/FimT family pseudopilin n=1 Tax=Shewanella sediminis TaxID=271097 RepID=UPI00167F9BDB
MIGNLNSKDNVKGPTTPFTFSPKGLSSGATIIYCPGGKSSRSKSISVSSRGLISYGEDGKSC